MTQKPFCTSCGNELVANQPFCSQCGAPVEQHLVGGGSHTIRLGDPVVSPTIALSTAPGVAPNSGNGTPPTVARGAKRAWLKLPRLNPRHMLIASALIGLLVVAGAGYSAWTKGPQRTPGIPKLLVASDEGNNVQTLYLMGLTANEKVQLGEDIVPSTHATSAYIYQVDASPYQQQHWGVGFASNRGLGVFLATQQRVVYTTPVDGEVWEVYSVDLNGQNTVQLSPGAVYVYGQVSDAAGIMLIREIDDEGRSSLILTDLKGTKTPLIEGASTAGGELAPDGKHIALYECDNMQECTITVVDATGKNEVEIATDVENPNIVWSQNGAKLFVSMTNASRTRTLMMDPDGQNQQELARRGRITRAHIVQNKVVYSLLDEQHTESLYVINSDGSDKRDLVRGSNGLAWTISADQGSVIASSYRNNRYTLNRFPIKGGEAIELGRSTGSIMWLEDGDRFVLVTSNSSSYRVTNVDQQGQDEQEIADGLDQIDGLAVHNGQVAFGGRDSGQAMLHFWDGDKLHTLADDADAYRDVLFTPDGRSIIYTDIIGETASDATVYKIDTNGKHREQLMEPAMIVNSGW